MGRRAEYSFVFVCQAGPLESKAVLLAASLSRHLPQDSEFIAAIPTPEAQWGALAPSTRDLLSRFNIKFVEIRNEIDPTYPIGNKVSCLKIETDGRRLIFLDTDVIMSRPFGPEVRFDLPFAAKPADLPNVISDRQWKRAYAACKARFPDSCVATTLYGQIVLPYFNAGFIVVDPKVGLGDVWLDCCRRIDAKWGIGLKRPHLDQIALPVAVHKLKLAYECLDERFNFPAHLKPLDHGKLPLFAHYHTPAVLRREPMLVELVRDMCREHPQLAEHLSADADFAPILRGRMPSSGTAGSRRPASASPTIIGRKLGGSPQLTPELIITGIPRSGTSYLCNLLHRFDNCVMLNESDGIGKPLRKEPIPFGIGTFFRDMRRDVVEGRPIRNKLRDGKVTDETMEANEQTEYLPSVVDGQFVLGVKNPLGFLTRLQDIRRAMPQARIIACVRNPFDTIASWKTTFAHLKTANVAKIMHGGLLDPFLSARHRAALRDVAAVKNVAWRRAAWWRYLAELIVSAGPDVTVIQYWRAVMDPVAVTGRILDGMNAGDPRESIEPSVVRASKRDALDEEDLQAIRALCTEPAMSLGVGDGWDDAEAAAARSAPAAVAAAPVVASSSPLVAAG